MEIPKPIILIGGAAGTGKTSLARDLVRKLDLDHQLGGGFVREIVRTETDPQKDSLLFGFTFSGDDPIRTVSAQAKRIKRAVQACIERARREGTSLALEGAMLVPEYYVDMQTLFIVLDAGSREQHKERLHGERHTKRFLSEAEVDSAQKMNDYYREQAEKFGIPFVRYEDNLEEINEILFK